MLGDRFFYTLAMVLAMILASVLLRSSQRKLPVTRVQRFGILAGALMGAMFAAKLPFVIMHAELGMASWLSDGKTILWALVGGYFGVEVAKWSLDVRVRTGDTFVIPVALAVSLGRIGCLFFGCCYGVPTDLPWGLSFVTAEDGGALARHPTQIYECIFHLIFAIIAFFLSRKQILSSQLMPLYILVYAGYRFFSEFLRPEPTLLFSLTLYQISAIPIAIVMLTIIVVRGSIVQPMNPRVEPTVTE